MFTKISFLSTLLTIAVGHTIPMFSKPINVYSDPINMYYDDDANESGNNINEISVEEGYNFKPRATQFTNLRVLSPGDIKCLIEFNDRHCSANMKAMKRAVIGAISDNCIKCTITEKEEAGKIMTTVMRDFPFAWKLIYTRYRTPKIEEDLPVPDKVFFLRPRIHKTIAA